MGNHKCEKPALAHLGPPYYGGRAKAGYAGRAGQGVRLKSSWMGTKGL